MKTDYGKNKVSPRRSILPPCGILVENHQHKPGFQTAVHAHRHNSLIYIISGRGKCLTDGNEYDLVATTALLLKKGQKHQLIDEPRKAMVVFVAYFSEHKAKLDKDLVNQLLSKSCIAVPLQFARQIRNALRQMLREQNDRPEHYEAALRQWLAYTMINLNRAVSFESRHAKRLISSNSSERVRAVLDYTAEHYQERNNVSEAARAAHLSQRHFANICRKLTGSSYVQFLNRLRVQKAKELLENTKMPVLAVAFEVGFEELSTFYRAFRKVHRANPLQFRTASK